MKELTAENKLDLIRKVNGAVNYDKMTMKVMKTVIASQQSVIYNLLNTVKNTHYLNDLCYMWDGICSCIEQTQKEREVYDSAYFAIPKTKVLQFELRDKKLWLMKPELTEKECYQFVLALRNVIRVMNYWKA